MLVFARSQGKNCNGSKIFRRRVPNTASDGWLFTLKYYMRAHFHDHGREMNTCTKSFIVWEHVLLMR